MDNTVSWRGIDDTNSWTDFVKRIAMVGSFFVSTVITYYYMKTKRRDLSNKQTLYLTLCGLGYASQVAIKLFYIQRHRPVPMEESIGFTIITPFMYLLPAYVAKSEPKNKNIVKYQYILGGLSFILGLYIEMKAEYDRMIFKEDINNKGKLYTIGWNKYCRNPNYFAELLVYIGWNCFTFNSYLIFLESGFMALSFYFYHIPEKEEYLSQKYVQEWSDYAENVKALIPFVY